MQLLPVVPTEHDVVAMPAPLVALHKLGLLEFREGCLDRLGWVRQVAPDDLRVRQAAPVVIGRGKAYGAYPNSSIRQSC